MAFSKLAWSRVLAEPDLVGWGEERERIGAQIAADARVGSLERGLIAVPAVPSPTAADRVRWLDRLHNADHVQEPRTEISLLVGLVLDWHVARTQPGPVLAWASELVDAIETRPFLLYETDTRGDLPRRGHARRMVNGQGYSVVTGALKP